MKKKKIKNIISIVVLIVLCVTILILYAKYMSIVYTEHPEGKLYVRLRTEESNLGNYSWVGSMSDEGILYEKDCYVQSGVFGDYYYWVYDICHNAGEGTITLQYKLSFQDGSMMPEECGRFELQFYVGEDGTITQIGGAEPPEETNAWKKFWREYGYLRDQFFGYAWNYMQYVLWELIGLIVLPFFEFIQFLSDIYRYIKG